MLRDPPKWSSLLMSCGFNCLWNGRRSSCRQTSPSFELWVAISNAVVGVVKRILFYHCNLIELKLWLTERSISDSCISASSRVATFSLILDVTSRVPHGYIYYIIFFEGKWEREYRLRVELLPTHCLCEHLYGFSSIFKCIYFKSVHSCYFR